MKTPILIFAFANKSDRPLPDLLEEDRILNDSFRQLVADNKFAIHREQNATASGIIDSLRDFKNTVSIFHFGGHASTSHLYLIDQSASGKGLSQMLGMQKSLQLVFLNGCNTSGFIRQLLDQGVPAVIATTREINDTVALQFAEEFYKSMTAGYTIGEAFDFAKSAIETGPDVKHPVSRGVVLPDESQADFSWGLYLDEKDEKAKERALNWKLNNAREDVNPLPERFWLKFALLAIPIALLYLWSIINFGFENITLALTILTVIITISSFLANFLSKKNPRTLRIFKGLQSAALKPVFIAAIILISTAAIAMISSIRIGNLGLKPLGLTNAKGKSMPFIQLGAADSKQTTIMAFVEPFSRQHNLSLDGYEPEKLQYHWFTGVSLPVDSLLAHPSVLVRLSPELIGYKTVLKVRVKRNNMPYFSKAGNLSSSMVLGNQEIDLKAKTESYTESWKQELALRVAPEYYPQYLEDWKIFTKIDSIELLHVGDHLLIELLSPRDSVLRRLDTIVPNNSFTDVQIK